MNKCLNCDKETNNKKFCSISCQNKYQNSEKSNIKFGIFKEFVVKCGNCDKDFIIEEREKIFPQKEKYYCCRKCANTRKHNEETKNKISLSLIKSAEFKLCVCKNCEKEFSALKRKNRIFCSRSCSTTWNNIHKGIGRKAGLASVKIQSEKRRSKNEIYFAELCKQKFKEVLTNKPIFNGWDADIIIEDIKTAVLWNGKWHYEKIKKGTSVKQIQNRDKIKESEIIESGYKVYIIKDMGKYKKEFVESEFDKFILKIFWWN